MTFCQNRASKLNPWLLYWRQEAKYLGYPCYLPGVSTETWIFYRGADCSTVRYEFNLSQAWNQEQTFLWLGISIQVERSCWRQRDSICLCRVQNLGEKFLCFRCKNRGIYLEAPFKKITWNFRVIHDVSIPFKCTDYLNVFLKVCFRGKQRKTQRKSFHHFLFFPEQNGRILRPN